MLTVWLHKRACKLHDFCYTQVTTVQSISALPEIRVFQIAWMKHLNSWCHVCTCRSREGKGRILFSPGSCALYLVLSLTKGILVRPKACGGLEAGWWDLLSACPSPSFCFLQSDPDLPPDPQTSSSADLGKFPGLPSHPVSQYVPPQPSIEEARQTMHSLLDDAFALVAPSSQAANSTAVTPPGVSAGQPVNNTPARAGRGTTCTQWGSPYGPTQAVNIPFNVSDAMWKAFLGRQLAPVEPWSLLFRPFCQGLPQMQNSFWIQESFEMAIIIWWSSVFFFLFPNPTTRENRSSSLG